MPSRTFVLSAALYLSACSTQDPAMDTQPMDASTPSPDAAAPPACTPTTCASIQGVVKRKAGVRPQNGGKGSLYISVMDGDPVLSGGKVNPLAVQIIPGVDMNPDDVAIPYKLLDVPVRKEPSFIVAFLDDNGTVNSDKPGPDKGDLLSLEGLSAPKITVDQPGPQSYDITLNTYLPF